MHMYILLFWCSDNNDEATESVANKLLKVQFLEVCA